MGKYPGSVLGTFKAQRINGKPNWLVRKFKDWEDVLIGRGLKKFSINGKTIIALNQKNAERKYKLYHSK